ncbi:hypothetical protein HELA111659_03630 [Helicobacter labetoulli]|nr:hypothetical protein [Helicobacter labetoulli]
MSKFNEESIEKLFLYECKNAEKVARKKDEWILKEIFLDSITCINFESKSNYDFLSAEQKEYLALEAYKNILALSDVKALLHTSLEIYNTYGRRGVNSAPAKIKEEIEKLLNDKSTKEEEECL